MGSVLSYIAARLTEASTWAGLASLFAIVHLNVDPGLLKSITLLGTGMGGILAFFIPGGAANSSK